MTTIEQEIRVYEEELRQADASPEPDTSAILDKYLADDVLMHGPKGESLGNAKAFILEAHRPPKKQAFDEVKLSDMKVKVLNENVAVVTCRGDYRIQGQSFALRFLRVWSKVGGEWKIVAGSVTGLG